MFGTSTSKIDKVEEPKPDSQLTADTPETSELASESKRKDDASPVRPTSDDTKAAEEPPLSSPTEKKRRTGSVSKAKDLFSSAKQSLSFSHSSSTEKSNISSMQRLSKNDPALGVPQGSLNNSAGESLPGPNSTFRVGVTEDKNKKCRRTMEDTHAYLYNFLSTPKIDPETQSSVIDDATHVVETDNGYFAIFDGHAGNFAADWCGKKLHLLLEDTIRKHPNTPLPELLDQTFTQVDKELEKLPLKNSGTTAVIAVLRWEDRVPNPQSATGTAFLNQAAAKDATSQDTSAEGDVQAGNQGNGNAAPDIQKIQASEAKLRSSAVRQRVLYTANVGDARIILCRNGRALRLSYDHKGSDEGEGRRIANAGGLILNNRVNGVLAVTRALGDTYMKDLVTGHPYTTETVIQPEHDEFLILACDGLWDVCSDQEAVDLVRNVEDPQSASKTLVDHALGRFSTDNLSCMVVRFDNKALKSIQEESSIGVEGDNKTAKGGISEADAIVSEAKKQLDEGLVPDGEETPSKHAEKEDEETDGQSKEMPIHLNKDAVVAAQKNPS